MKNFLLKVVNGEEKEWSRIALLLTLGFFTGIFLSTYDVASTSLFLETFKENKDVMLAWAMVGAGVLGISSTILLSRLQRTVPYQILAVRMLIFILLIIAPIAVGLRFYAPNSPELVFLANIIIGPSNAIVILLFWGIFGRIFPFRAAVRLAGGIDTGQAIATIIGLFTIPLIQPYLSDVIDFLIISSIALIGCVVVAYLMSQRFTMIESKPQVQVAGQGGSAEEEAKRKKGNASIRKNKYAQAISFFVVSSALAASFVDYTFLSTAAEQFSQQEDLTQFLSFFGAFIIIASFLVQTFLNDLIIDFFGLKVSLLLLPFMLVLFTIASLAVAYIFGYTVKEAGDDFLSFFVIVSMSKLFVDAFRDSLENPTVKLFFFPLDTSIRFDIQTKIEGVISQSAGLLAGIFITSLERLQFFDLIECLYFIILIVVAWVVSTFRMHQGYTRVLSSTLLDIKQKYQSSGENDHVIPKLLTKQLHATQEEAFAITARISTKIDPLLFERYVITFSEVNSREKQRQMLLWIKKRRIAKAIPSLEKFAQRAAAWDNVSLAKEIYQELSSLQEESQDDEYMQQLIYSASAKDRIKAAKLLAFRNSEIPDPWIIALVRDLNADVKRAVFLTIGKLKLEAFLPLLIDHMSVVGFENTAVSAILNYGEHAMMQLEMAFYRNGQKQNALINIVQMYGLIGGDRAIELLLRKTGIPDKKILKEVLYSLNYCNWRAKGAMTAFIRSYLEQSVGHTLWLLVSTKEIRKNKRHRNIHKALKELIEHSYDEIFLLLSLLYDKESVRLVEDNIKAGTSDSVGYAMELVNIIVDDELKPMLLPILDDSSVEEKLRKLEGQFPRDSFDTVTVLQKIMNRDYNSVDRWTRTCATHAYGRHPKTRITDDLVANIFNPDPLVQETAGWAICLQSERAFIEFGSRLEEAEFQDLRRKVLPAVAHDDEGTLLSMAKVLFLYKLPLLDGVSGMVLADIIEWMDEVTLQKGDFLEMQNDLGHRRTVLIAQGKLESLNDKGEVEERFGKYEVVNHILRPTSNAKPIKRLVASSDCQVYIILSERLYEIMGDHYELTDKVLANLSTLVKRGMAKGHQAKESI